jgi:hypothetical protein
MKMEGILKKEFRKIITRRGVGNSNNSKGDSETERKKTSKNGIIWKHQKTEDNIIEKRNRNLKEETKT